MTLADGYPLQMNICRQCFREKSTDIGFNKVGFLPFHYIRTHQYRNRGTQESDAYFFQFTVPLKYQPEHRCLLFFFLPFLDPFVFTICIFRFHVARRLVKQKKPMGGKADSELKPEVMSSKQTDGRTWWMENAEGEIST